jgi:hypothetical protein
MIVLTNYANFAYRKSQKLNTSSALSLANVDKVISFSPSDIDKDFYKKNRHILRKSTGNGYWLWKPYFILKVLETISVDDVLIYSDSGIEFVGSVKPLIKLLDRSKHSILCFSLHGEIFKEENWTKRDAFVLMNCEGYKYTKTLQRNSSFIVMKKSEESINFVREWLLYCQDRNIVMGNQNLFGFPNPIGFIDHRHDQSVFSLLTKKYKIPSYRDPSQYGLPFKKEDKKSRYRQIINHHRRRRMSIKNFLMKYSGYRFLKKAFTKS